MKLKVMAALAVGVLPAFAVALTGSPAMADCPADTFCLYESADYHDGEFRFHPGTTCAQLPSGINNDANSMRNYRNYNIKMWDFPGCAGSLTYTARALSYDSTFDNNHFTNKASSLARV
jgi:hypothetical protein